MGPVPSFPDIVSSVAGSPDLAEDFVHRINSATDGWMRAMGIVVTSASADEVSCELEVDGRHHQGYGIVHGGVYSGIIESLASIGAALYAMPERQSVAGIENHTSFIRAVRSGRLHARATPLARGRRSHVWEASVWDERDRLAASGRVRLICLEEGVPLAGEQVNSRLLPPQI